MSLCLLCVHMHLSGADVEVWAPLAGTGSSLPPCGSQGSDTGPQAWQQAPLPAEPPKWPYQCLLHATIPDANQTAVARTNEKNSGHCFLCRALTQGSYSRVIHMVLPRGSFMRWSLSSKDPLLRKFVRIKLYLYMHPCLCVSWLTGSQTSLRSTVTKAICCQA